MRTIKKNHRSKFLSGMNKLALNKNIDEIIAYINTMKGELTSEQLYQVFKIIYNNGIFDIRLYETLLRNGYFPRNIIPNYDYLIKCKVSAVSTLEMFERNNICLRMQIMNDDGYGFPLWWLCITDGFVVKPHHELIFFLSYIKNRDGITIWFKDTNGKMLYEVLTEMNFPKDITLRRAMADSLTSLIIY